VKNEDNLNARIQGAVCRGLIVQERQRIGQRDAAQDA
jgi:hypothetical protein